MFELFQRGDGVSERITAIFDLAERGLDSATFNRIMTIMVDLRVDPNLAILIDDMVALEAFWFGG